MNGAINFTQTFSSGVVWHWPIAVYLLLAGMSGGALIVAILIRYYKKQNEFSFATILLGMVCLVGDLDKPLYFWKILINYNFKSVMSIGVLALCFYIPLSFFICLYAFEKELLPRIGMFRNLLEFVMKILTPIRTFVIFLALIFAVVICAYTGFLISVLVRFPLLNTAVLPALFIASGLSAGIGASGLVAKILFKADHEHGDLHTLHVIEWPVMAAEILLIAMIFVSLVLGSDTQKFASVAFYNGGYAIMFWLGVVGIGFCVPIIFNFLLGKKISSSLLAFYVSGFSSILGVLMLRMFILYAGQTYSIFM